jgi:drug/metabolite transporter (DMT)-like permease
MNRTPSLTGHDWGILAILALVWGSSFLLIELGLTGFGPLTLVFLRIALAVPLMLVAMRVAGQLLPRDARSWWQLTIIGFFNLAFSQALFFWAQTRIDSSLASILNATVPLWGVVMAHYFTADERATRAKVLGVLVGFSGLVVMVGPGALAGVGQDVPAQLACLLATACFAAAAVYARRLSAHVQPLAAATGQMITAAVMLAPLPLLFESPFAAVPPATAIAALLTLALVGTSFTYLLYFRLIATAGASNAMLIALLMPPVAIVLGVLLLNESLSGGQVAGMALILAGLIIIDGRLFARLAPARPVP